MKKILLLLITALTLLLAACNLSTKSEVDKNDDASSKKTDAKAQEIEILSMSSNEDDLNILRDQLSKNGFDVKLNIQPDYGSFTSQKDAGNYDVALSSWTTVTGNPDYAVRSLFTSDGDNSVVKDEKLDELINKASTQTKDEYTATYKQLEQRLVFDEAYIVPLYTSYKAQGINSNVIDESTVRLPKSRAAVWENISFKDKANNVKEPLVTQQAIGELTSLDPIKGNDGSINTLNTNMYVRLVNLTDDDEVVSDGSLSYNYASAKDNKNYYFLLRDDINFAKVTNKKAVDTGERVGAEDVKFSLDRAKDSKSVPDHRTYSLHENMKDIEIVTDTKELEAQTADGKSIREALEDGVDSKIKSLEADKTAVDNKAGKYQVVKVTTTEAFPQVLNYLAHQSAGIVSEKQVSKINTYDVAKYNADKDVSYGDAATITEGKAYNNELYASGPYVLTTKNDYEAKFEKNPAYRAGSEYEPKIANVTVKFIADPDSALSSLRNGDIHILNGVPETKYELVENDKKLTLQKNKSNGVTYLTFNMNDANIAKNTKLRQAVLYSVDQNAIIDFYKGNKMNAVSTVSPLVDTGNKVEADAKKAKALLEEASK
ncbi:ABC transporter substrate-binding protein [Kurthia senegalensis]|uniref:ABC transporter substrate-binding protein n=1 Tax=Kurthia senegalensis TaxID=1033740 RepID=UPI00028803F0|nr:ABC transporter substrate-binding protein [Kurthia senegalensis]